ncbi:hypothetical protein HGM15179_018576 [Zosterops borbonicus]|uniref:Reverse transcriptase n=1 Tax=Zosterops borbonicus TaxID=364589 RepID=A0A8K1FWJ9_9PASS|nr:hypothetical protein HGM15179_018576 [Zosterops borbonicus]
MYRLGNKTLDSSSTERGMGVLVNGKLNISQQCALAARRANHILRHSITSWSKEVIVLLYSALVGPHLEYCVQIWAPQYKKDIQLLESTQRRAMKGLEEKPFEEQLRSLDFFSLEKRRLKGDLIAVYNFLVRGGGGADTDLFTLVTSDRI